VVSALKSFSSGDIFILFSKTKIINNHYRYLDGRLGQSEPLMTKGNPFGNKYLNWIFVPVFGGNIYGIKSVSSGIFLNVEVKNRR